MVISIGFHLLITIVLVLGIPVPLAEGVTTYGGYLWVEALPSNTNGPYYLVSKISIFEFFVCQPSCLCFG